MCRRTTLVEHRFLYIDLARRQVLGVFPRSERSTNADAHARHLQDTYEQWFCTEASGWIRDRAKTCLVRACFGLEELREKLVADDAHIDDYRLEMLKCIVLAQDPRYAAAQVATLRLDRIRDDTLELIPVNANDQPLDDLVKIPRTELALVPLDEMRRAFPQVAVGPHVSMLRLATPIP